MGFDHLEKVGVVHSFDQTRPRQAAGSAVATTPAESRELFVRLPQPYADHDQNSVRRTRVGWRLRRHQQAADRCRRGGSAEVSTSSKAARRMSSSSSVGIGRHLFPTFATAVQYHQNRPGHAVIPRFVLHGVSTGEADEWNVVFHERNDDPIVGDVVAYRVETQIDAHTLMRSLLLLLAEDVSFDTSADRWRLAIRQAQRRGTLSDVSTVAASRTPSVEHEHSDDPERSYRHRTGRETWWRNRVTFHRGVRIETRVKTMQGDDGRVTAQDATISLTDGRHPREFSVPIAVLDQVIDALTVARDDAVAINATLRR
ncbi:hypothetical protein WKY82_13710 [Gordonia malaquae]|uniref:hypothetical protein n=1 Tax=Gordonia TaxID=2053 RepID=UPI0030C797E2